MLFSAAFGIRREDSEGLYLGVPTGHHGVEATASRPPIIFVAQVVDVVFVDIVLRERLRREQQRGVEE